MLYLSSINRFMVCYVLLHFVLFIIAQEEYELLLRVAQHDFTLYTSV